MLHNLTSRIQTLQRVLESPHSTFYAKKYANVVLTPDHFTEDQWRTIPFLTRTEIQETNYFDRLYTDADNVGIIRVTSGTSGKGLLIMPRTKSDTRESELFRKIFSHYKFRTMATFSGAQFQHARIYITDYNIDSVALSVSDIAASANIVTTLKPDLLLGFGYALEALGKAVKDDHYAKTVSCIYFFGERTSDLRLRAIRSYFPNADLMFDYASIEAQVSPAMSCLELIKQRSTYVHPIPEYTYMEIIDPETGKVITEPGVEGELVMTITKQVAFPLIRYRTGDQARIIAESCPCGTVSPIIDIRGRVEGTKARFRGGEIQLAELERALAKVVKHAPVTVVNINFNEEATADGILPRLSLKLQNAAAFDFTQLANELAGELKVSPVATYADGVSNNLLQPIIITEAAPGEELRKSRGIVVGN